MKNSQRFNAALISLLVAGRVFSSSAVFADSSSVNDSAKEVGNNFGELLKGMGQEAKKGLGSLSSSEKKDKKEESEKKPNKSSDKSKEETNTNK